MSSDGQIMNDDKIMSQIIQREEDKIKMNKVRKDRLWCQIELLKMRLASPLESRSVKKTIRGWLELKTKQYGEYI